MENLDDFELKWTEQPKPKNGTSDKNKSGKSGKKKLKGQEKEECAPEEKNQKERELVEIPPELAEIWSASRKTKFIEPAAPEVLLAMKHLNPQHMLATKRLKKVKEEEAFQLLGQGLPTGWVACRAKEGEVYYHNITSGASQWAHPGKTWASGQGDPATMDDLIKSFESETAKEGKLADAPKEHSIYDARSRHVPLPAPPTLFSDVTTNITREDLYGRAFALHGLLTPAEAGSYVSSAEATGFKGSDVAREFPSEVRNNSRLVHFSDELSASLWHRLAPHLAHRDIYLMQPMGYDAEGRWKPVGVNPCFRIARYQTGEHFAAHRDGMYVNDQGECSIYSIILYLNDDYEGGHLELPEHNVFRPRAGSAVLLPHDMLHTATEVLDGSKYVVRSELMFRCVESRPAPSVPAYVNDPQFQRMASLYEQIGDLAAMGDAAATTAAYQEALGIQIAHKGTMAAPTTSRLPIPAKLLSFLLSFFAPAEVLDLLPCSTEWRNASLAGALWREYFRDRFPDSSEVVEDDLRGLDAELKDWHGMYRRLFLMDRKGTACTVYLTGLVNAKRQGQKPIEAVPAKASLNNTGVGWDRSFKKRHGWSVGSPYAAQNLWVKPDALEVDWEVLPEIIRFALNKLDVRPCEHRVIIPTLPGIWTRGVCTRMAKIMATRFQVPHVYFVPAPLCALLAHSLSAGVVVWGCDLGRSMVYCFHEKKEVSVAGPFDFNTAKPQEVASLICQAVKDVSPEVETEVLRHVIFSRQQVLKKSNMNFLYCTGKASAIKQEEDDSSPWLDIDKIMACLQDASSDVVEKCKLADTEFHKPKKDDVLKGADLLVALPEQLNSCEIALEEPMYWEWRMLTNGKWHRLPAYVCSVFEGALRNSQRFTSVFIGAASNVYLIADLEQLTVAVVRSPMFWLEEGRRKGRGSKEAITEEKLAEAEIMTPWCKLTRFLRGRPSATPDFRKPDDIRQAMRPEVEAVERVSEEEGVHVCTLAGKLVFSVPGRSVQTWFVEDLIGELSAVLDRSPQQLKLLMAGRPLEADEALRPLLEAEGSLELTVLVGQAVKDESEDMEEWIPDELPGDHNDIQHDGKHLRSLIIKARARK